MADEEHLQELKDRAKIVLEWAQKETGHRPSPVDEQRVELLVGHLRWAHELRNEPPSVATETGGVKTRPEHTALISHMRAAGAILRDVERPVLAARAAAAEANKPEDIDEIMRRKHAALVGQALASTPTN